MLTMKMDVCLWNWSHKEYIKSFEKISSCVLWGFYSNCDESIQMKVKDYIDKTYNDAFKYLLELMKRDLESDKL